MYLNSDASGEFQIWRQRFSRGKPEQVTFGPSQAEGVTAAPDGKSLLTGIGFVQHSIVFHNGESEQAVTAQGDSIFPSWGDGFPTSVFSPDGSKLYYLLHSRMSRAFGGGELWVHDFASGANHSVLPHILVTSFDLSPDGTRIVFGALDDAAVPRLWLGRVDERTPPVRVFSGEAAGPVFGAGGEVYFRAPEGKQWFVFAVNPDSGAARKLIAEPSLDAPVVSPDRKWVVATTPFAGADSTSRVQAFPVGGGEPLVICERCFLKWSGDQRGLFVSFRMANAASLGETTVIPLSPGQAFPRLPRGGLTAESARGLSGAKSISITGVFPGVHPPQYAFVNSVAHRNLYRVVLPQ